VFYREEGRIALTSLQGLGVVLNVSLLSGAKCVVMAKFDLAQACQLIQDHRLTFVYVPPPIILALGKHPLVSQYDLSSLRFVNSAAAPLSRDLVDAVWDRLGVMVKQGYGLTETSPAVSVQMFDEWRRYLGSVGRLVPNMQAKVVDPEGKELPPNEVCVAFCRIYKIVNESTVRRAAPERPKRLPRLLE
jgi:acyl-coenzyme A synthetase/AMP-(fatty) acid ligase